MKAVYVIVSALASLAIAAPSANQLNEVPAAATEKRQQLTCGPCVNGRKTCYYCPTTQCFYSGHNC